MASNIPDKVKHYINLNKYGACNNTKKIELANDAEEIKSIKALAQLKDTEVVVMGDAEALYMYDVMKVADKNNLEIYYV